MNEGEAPESQAAGGDPTTHVGLLAATPLTALLGAETLPAEILNFGSLSWQQSARFHRVTEKMVAGPPKSILTHDHPSFHAVAAMFGGVPRHPPGFHGAPFVRYNVGSCPSVDELDLTVALRAMLTAPG